MGKYTPYSEKLKHPKWQKKRLQVFERDKFRCQLCWTNDKPLHVHHKYYNKNCEPWDYQLQAFLTLCEDCHEKLHPKKKKTYAQEQAEKEERSELQKQEDIKHGRRKPDTLSKSERERMLARGRFFDKFLTDEELRKKYENV